MDTFSHVAAATVRIACGDSSGSGFHFASPGTFVTCYHVIEGAPDSVEAITPQGEPLPLGFVTGSASDELDYAVFRSSDEPDLPVLEPGEPATLGLPVLFAGFPHGFPKLLVQRATVAGDESVETFYLDGSVNEGNSGGPVVDADSGAVVGVLTATRFPGIDDLNEMAESARQVYEYDVEIAKTGADAKVMGIDVLEVVKRMARTNLLLHQLLIANANSGIGVALRIAEVKGI